MLDHYDHIIVYNGTEHFLYALAEIWPRPRIHATIGSSLKHFLIDLKSDSSISCKRKYGVGIVPKAF